MATLPAGTLMQRAAAGLARRCALLLADRGGVYGAPGAAAGRLRRQRRRRAVRRARGWPGRGAAVSALLLTPGRAHAGGLAALRAAGGRVVDRPPRRVDLVLDGIVGIGGTGGLRRAGRRLVAEPRPGCAGATAARPSWSRSTCPAGSRSTPASAADRVRPAQRGPRRRDGGLRRAEAGAGGRPGRGAGRPGRAGRHRAAAVAARHARRCG